MAHLRLQFLRFLPQDKSLIYLFSGKMVESNLVSFISCYLGSQLAVLSLGKDRSRENRKAESLMESYRNGKKWTR